MSPSTASTAFVASSALLGPSVVLTAGLAAAGFPAFVSAAPILLVSRKMVNQEDTEGRWQFLAKYTTMHVLFGAFNLALAWLLGLPFGAWRLNGFHALMLYVPFFTIINHDRSQNYGPVQTIIMRYGFDAPLVTAGWLSREIFGARLFAPFATIFDDLIVQGSLPFPSDIKVLASEPYRVGLIVNMCREWPGARAQLCLHGVEQVWLPMQDTCAPDYAGVVAGCDAIKAFQARQPGKRIFIHCKGGIARASTMSLAHYIRNEGVVAADALAMMKGKRSVIMEACALFPAIVKLEEERIRGLKPSSSG